MFGKPIGGKQIQQIRLADMLTNITQGQLLCLQLGRLKDAGTMTPQQVSLAKRANVNMACDIAREARRRFPALQQAAIIRGWAIPVAFVSDNRPLLGPVDEVAGLLVATGLKSTIILTPLVGALVADMVAGRNLDPRLAEFSPSRAVAGT